MEAAFRMGEHNAFIVILYSLFIHGVTCNYGVVDVKTEGNDNSRDKFCVMYNSKFHQLPHTQEDAPIKPLLDLTPSELCEEPSTPPDVPDAVWAVNRGNCTFTDKARIVQKNGGNTVLVVSNGSLITPGVNSTSDYNDINITVALIKNEDFIKMKTLGQNLRLQFYAPPPPKLDYNLIVIFCVAVGTVMIGSYLSGRRKQELYVKKTQVGRGGGRGGVDVRQEEDEPVHVDLTWPCIIVLVVLMCSMLLLLYFFYDYLVYLVIGLFAVASSSALYNSLKPLMLKIPCIRSCRIPCVKIPYVKCCRGGIEVRRLVLALLCLAVGIVWLVFRNAPWAWILQDILGILFCVQMLKTLRLPNFKSICILLVLLFFYDIFFVFITPLLTKKGESIMVDVATGGKSKTGEMLPMVFKVPRIDQSIMSMCGMPFSLLGYGDIMVPGLLVSYCYGFDLKVGSTAIYYAVTVIAYGVGLGLTFVALALMEVGQPALLYLVPCTLLTALLTALIRRELSHFWHGEARDKMGPVDETTEASGNETDDTCHAANSTVEENKAATVASPPGYKRQASDTSNEQEGLLVNT